MKKTLYTIAIALALFSGSVSTYGLTHFAPGAEWVVAVMGLLFEAGKLSAFAVMNRRLPAALKCGLLVVGVILMGLNIVGVSGFLSNHFEREQVTARATNHTAETEAKALVSTLERQLSTVEARIAQATASMGKARGDRDQIKAVNALISSATVERNRIAQDLTAAQVKQAKVEGSTIQASGEVAAIAFVAELTGTDVSTTAHRVFLVVASLPELLAVLLLLSAELGTAVPQPLPAPAPVAAQVATAVAAAAPAPVKTKPAKPAKDPRKVKAGVKAAATRKRNAAAQKKAGLHVVTA